MLKVVFLNLVLSSLSFASAVTLQHDPPKVQAPQNTIPYSETLCKTKKGKGAFSFVKIKPKFDKNGCVRPLQSWVFDDKKNNWVPINPKSVVCCDPMAEAGMEP